MAANRKPTVNKQVFDVTKPGKAAAPATSRPVIVNHGPMLQDPMVSQSAKEGEVKDTKAAKEEDTPVTVSSHKVIMPSAEMEASVKPEAETGSTEIEAKQDGEEADQKDSKADAAPTKSTETEKDSAAKTDDSKETTDVLAASGKPQKDGQQEEELARQAQLEALIESRKYAVPIDEMHRRSQRRFLNVFGVILILALIGGYLAVDAGVIDVAIDLPFEIIKD